MNTTAPSPPPDAVAAQPSPATDPPFLRRIARPYRQLLQVLVGTISLLLVHGLWGQELTVLSLKVVPPDLGLSTERNRPPIAAPSIAMAREVTTPREAEPSTTTISPSTSSRPIDSSPRRILFFGDSMVEVLKDHLNSHLLPHGHRLFPAIWYASTTASWAQSDRLDALLREVNPTLVLISLGSSELTVLHVEQRERHVRAIVARIGSRPLVWIGPPNWRPDTGINAMLARVLGPDRFFRSGALDLERGPDGIHPNVAGGAIWALSITRFLRDESASPLLSTEDPGPSPTPKVAAVAVFPPPR